MVTWKDCCSTNLEIIPNNRPFHKGETKVIFTTWLITTNILAEVIKEFPSHHDLL